MFLPSYYPERTIAGDRVGDQDIVIDRPDQASDFKKVETKVEAKPAVAKEEVKAEPVKVEETK